MATRKYSSISLKVVSLTVLIALVFMFLPLQAQAQAKAGNGSISIKEPKPTGVPVKKSGKTALIKITIPKKQLVPPSKIKTKIPQDTSGAFLPVVPNIAGIVEGWVEVFTADCSVDGEGSYTVPVAPTHGQLNFAITNQVAGSGQLCAGDVLPFNTAYYTWTDPDTTAQDPFTLEWTFSTPIDNSWVAAVGSPQQGKDTGSPTSPDAPPGSCTCGDPIDLGSGNVSEAITDYTTAGVNALAFTRYYNSRASSATYAQSLGGDWRDTYDRYLHIVSPTSVLVEREDGQMLQFTLNGSTWQSDSDIHIILSQTGSGTGSIWTLRDRDDSIETYTQLSTGEGLLTSIKARDGYTQVLTYNSANQLTSVSDSFNRVLTFSYQGALLLTFTTPEGLVFTYGYSSSGLTPNVNDQLASVSYSDSSDQWLYSYNNFGFLLTSITDTFVIGGVFASTVYRTWSYDSEGRAITSQNGVNAAPLAVSYDDTTGNRTITNPLGQSETYKFAVLQGIPKIVEMDRLATGNVPAATEIFTYDSNGYVASETDWNGNLTTYVNNAQGEPTSITEASGTSLARTTTMTYNAAFPDLPTQIVAPRVTTTFTYDAHGNVLTQTGTDTSGGSTNGQTRTWTYTYDSLGHVLTAIGPRTDVTQTTTYTYTGNDITSITDALGHVTKITSHNGSGQPLSLTDPNGVVTTFTYDLEDRLLTSTVHAASGNATTSFAYQALTNTTQTPSLMTLPDGGQFSFQYDPANNVTLATDILDGASVVYTRDADEDITQQQIVDGGGNTLKIQTGVFDSLGRMLQQIGAAGQTTTYTYDADGNVLSVQDPLGHTTTSTFDALNRLVRSVDPLNNTTSYAYDAQDNLTSVTDPRGLATTYTYDGFGDVLSAISPESGTTTYTYDRAGNLISQKDARGVVTNQTFDKLNRLLTTTYPASSSENITYTYDANNSSNFGIGQLTGITDASGTTAYTYNERGDVLTDTRAINGISYKTAYSYDLADNVTSITYPSGNLITYNRDALGRITSATYQPSANGVTTTLANNLTYDPFGPLTGLTYGNGLASTFTYNQDYLLTSIVTGGNSQVQNLAITYDAANNITSITDALDNTRNQTFGYDADNRLTQAAGKYGTLAYTYDADGNRTSLTANGVTTNYTYSSTSNRLSSTVTGNSTCTFTYAANGDTATENCGVTSAAVPTTATTFTYGNANTDQQTLVKHNPPPGTTFHSSSLKATYAYNALGERLLKTVAGNGGIVSVTGYTYDENGHLLAESNGSIGAMTQEYVWIGDMPVAQIEANGTIFYIHDDQSNTPQKMTDSSQTVVWDRIQEPFGETLSLTGTLTNNLRFPGQYFDSESNLNYNMNRFYDSSVGRYTQADPTGLRGGINLYVYVNANPIRYVDPHGTSVEVVAAWIGLIVVMMNLIETQWALEHPELPPASEQPNTCSMSNPYGLPQQYWENAPGTEPEELDELPESEPGLPAYQVPVYGFPMPLR